MKLTKAQKIEQQETSITFLKENIKADNIIYTSLQSVSSTGMSRRLKIYIVKDNQIIDITYDTANALEYRYNFEKGSLIIGGCGMDMGYYVVCSLTSLLNTRVTPENTNCYKLNHKWI